MVVFRAQIEHPAAAGLGQQESAQGQKTENVQAGPFSRPPNKKRAKRGNQQVKGRQSGIKVSVAKRIANGPLSRKRL